MHEGGRLSPLHDVDNSNRGWLIKLIEEVEEDMVEEEEVEVGAAIVESELVEIVFGSDTMKKI